MIMYSEGKKDSCQNLFKNIELEFHSEVTSTNTMLLERIKNENLPEGYTIIANAQTAGVGRHGRTFYSPEHTGVYMSVLLKPENIAEDTINMITVAAAVATANAVESISVNNVKIKWVNDIFIEDKKVAGILAQGQVNNKTGRVEQIVLGIGVNLYRPEHGFHEEIKDTAGYVLDDEGVEQRSNPKSDMKQTYITTLLNTFFFYYNKLEEKSYLEEYISRSLLIGKAVYVVKNGHKKTAQVLEINSDCNLVVEYAGGTKEVLLCGEVSLKL